MKVLLDIGSGFFSLHSISLQSFIIKESKIEIGRMWQKIATRKSKNLNIKNQNIKKKYSKNQKIKKLKDLKI